MITPSLGITKTVSPDTGVDAGDVISVTLSVTNSGTATAYDLLIEDVLVDPYFSLGTITNITLPAGYVSSTNATTLSILSDTNAAPAVRALMVGSNVTFTFDIALSQALAPNVTFTNRANLAYDSLDSTNRFNVQRAYTNTAIDVLTSGNFALAKVLWSTSETNNPPDSTNNLVQIGEILTYRLAVTAPEGTITNLSIVDTVTGGALAYIGGSATTDTSGFAGTLGTLGELPNLGLDVLSATNQQMTFTFSGNTLVDGGAGSTSNTFYLLLDYLVTTNAANAAGVTHTNRATVTYTGNPNPAVSRCDPYQQGDGDLHGQPEPGGIEQQRDHPGDRA